MKRKTIAILSSLLLFSSCNNSLSNNKIDYRLGLIKDPEDVSNFSEENLEDESYLEFLNKLNTFASKISSVYIEEKHDNSALSPLSIYMALALCVNSSSSSTREEILSTLNMTYEEINKYSSTLIRMLSFMDSSLDKKTINQLNITNSLWLDKRFDYNNETINSLANNLYSSSYYVDFANENQKANQMLKGFIKDKTNGLIDWTYDFDVSTAIVLLNTLYLKDCWNDEGLTTIDDKEFKSYDNAINKREFLSSEYILGNIYEEEEFQHFYATTSNGFKLKFILPNNENDIYQIMNSENIYNVNNIKDYNGVDQLNKKIYYTRNIFPSFKAETDIDLKDMLAKRFNINDLFYNCDFSSLIKNGSVNCNAIIHKTKLDVNKDGIEAAAVTAVEMNECSSVGEIIDDYEVVYQTLDLNKSFGYLLTDKNNTILFSGVINK